MGSRKSKSVLDGLSDEALCALVDMAGEMWGAWNRLAVYYGFIKEGKKFGGQKRETLAMIHKAFPELSETYFSIPTLARRSLPDFGDTEVNTLGFVLGYAPEIAEVPTRPYTGD